MKCGVVFYVDCEVVGEEVVFGDVERVRDGECFVVVEIDCEMFDVFLYCFVWNDWCVGENIVVFV